MFLLTILSALVKKAYFLILHSSTFANLDWYQTVSFNHTCKPYMLLKVYCHVLMVHSVMIETFHTKLWTQQNVTRNSAIANKKMAACAFNGMV